MTKIHTNVKKPRLTEGESMLHRHYERYGGFGQNYPLTAEEEEYDSVCRAIDYGSNALAAKPAFFFTAGELGWLQWFRSKTFFFTNQAQLDNQLLEIGVLLKTIEEREALGVSWIQVSNEEAKS